MSDVDVADPSMPSFCSIAFIHAEVITLPDTQLVYEVGNAACVTIAPMMPKNKTPINIFFLIVMVVVSLPMVQFHQVPQSLPARSLRAVRHHPFLRGAPP